MSVPSIIGLTGYAGSGKDEVRAILREHGYYGFAFADPLRAMLRALLEHAALGSQWMDSRSHKEQTIPPLGVSFRTMVQLLGTEWGRSLHPDFWVRIADSHMREVRDLTFGELRVVLSDVRFANEVAWIRNQGGVIWRIHRPGTAPVREHVSESGIDDIRPAHTIHNTGTLDDLRVTVSKLLGVWP